MRPTRSGSPPRFHDFGILIFSRLRFAWCGVHPLSEEPQARWSWHGRGSLRWGNLGTRCRRCWRRVLGALFPARGGDDDPVFAKQTQGCLPQQSSATGSDDDGRASPLRLYSGAGSQRGGLGCDFSCPVSDHSFGDAGLPGKIGPAGEHRRLHLLVDRAGLAWGEAADLGEPVSAQVETYWPTTWMRKRASRPVAMAILAAASTSFAAAALLLGVSSSRASRPSCSSVGKPGLDEHMPGENPESGCRQARGEGWM